MKKSFAAIFLLLNQVYLISAFPINCSLAENEPVEGSGMEPPPSPPPSPPPMVLNDYSIQFYYHQRRLKDSNCTEQFLEQNVSQHLCNSNMIKFNFPNGIIILMHLIFNN